MSVPSNEKEIDMNEMCPSLIQLDRLAYVCSRKNLMK